MREQPQQQFQYLGFRRFWPEPALAALLECFWSTGFGRGFVLSSQENVYPDGGCSLNITLGDAGPLATLTHNQQRGQRTFLTDAPCISARLHAGALFALFGILPASLGEQETEFSQLLTGAQLRSFRQLLAALTRLTAQAGWTTQAGWTAQAELATQAERATQAGLAGAAQCPPPEIAALQAFEQWLLDCAMNPAAQQNQTDSTRVALHLLSRPEHNVSATAQALGISSRTLERQLALQVGFSPRYYQLCQRMKNARQQLAGAELALVDVALQCGFYDQAHFSHAFARFVGETPAAYRQRKKISR